MAKGTVSSTYPTHSSTSSVCRMEERTGLEGLRFIDERKSGAFPQWRQDS